MTAQYQRRFPGYHTLGADPAATVRFVAQLRDCLTDGRDAVWHGEVTAPVDPALLRHLPPPAPSDADGHRSAAVRDWRAAYRPGRCYYRHGPGFVQIKDVREPGRFEIVNLTDPHAAETFLRCLRPVSVTELDGPARDAVRELVAERLVLAVGDHVVTLPHRMRRWPVPANVV